MYMYIYMHINIYIYMDFSPYFLKGPEVIMSHGKSRMTPGFLDKTDQYDPCGTTRNILSRYWD